MTGHEERLDEGWDLLDQGDLDGALHSAQTLLEQDRSHLGALMLAGAALHELGEPTEAERSFREALRIDPSQVEARVSLADLFYASCRFDESLGLAEEAIERDPGHASAHYLKGLSLDLMGRHAEADDSFRQAHRLDPGHYEEPASCSRGQFEAAVEKALNSLPPEFAGKIRDLPIVVEEVPAAALLLALENPDPDLLGLFIGTPLTEKSCNEAPGLPEAVYLFKRNLERACEGGDDLIEEIRVTLLHEIGHYLGMDEDALDEAGYA